MSTVIVLGNSAPVDSYRDAKTDELVRNVLEPFNTTTDVTLPNDPPIPPGEILKAIADLWSNHGDLDGPEWVEVDLVDDGEVDHYAAIRPALEAMVAAEFTTATHACAVGRPADWETTTP